MGGSAVAAAADDLLARRAVGDARFESDQVFASGAYAAVVEVERADRARCACGGWSRSTTPGRIVNPLLAEGQVIGGAVQGLGAVLTEEQVYAEGDPLSSLLDYALLTAAEIPEFATEFVETPSPLNPLGREGRSARAATIGAPRGGGQRARRTRSAAPRRPAVHRREGLAGAAVILEPLDGLAALACATRHVAAPASLLEEADEDTAHGDLCRVHGADGRSRVTATADGTRLHLRRRRSRPTLQRRARTRAAFGRFVAGAPLVR